MGSASGPKQVYQHYCQPLPASPPCFPSTQPSLVISQPHLTHDSWRILIALTHQASGKVSTKPQSQLRLSSESLQSLDFSSAHEKPQPGVRMFGKAALARVLVCSVLAVRAKLVLVPAAERLKLLPVCQNLPELECVTKNL